MNLTTETLLGQFLEPVFRALPRSAAVEIAELTADPVMQARVQYLAGRANEGELTDQELAEYQALIEAGDVLAIMQALARGTLGNTIPGSTTS